MQAELKSRVLKFGHRGPNGHKMATKKVGGFSNGFTEVHFFVTGQIGMKFQQKTSIGAYIGP